MAISNKQRHQNYAMLFNAVIDSGSWAQWSDKARAVYVVLLRHAYNREGAARKAILSIKTIAKESGKGVDSITPAARELALSGWITIKKGSAKIKYMNIYEVHPEQHLPDLHRQMSDINTSRSKPGKCFQNRAAHTGRFCTGVPVVTPDSHLPDLHQEATSRSKTVKKNTINTKEDIKGAGSASACQGQASPAIYKEQYILDVLVKQMGIEAVRQMIKNGEIVLGEGVRLGKNDTTKI